ncbi:MAG: mycofactocin precursor [Proteobacteria bacterium]|nr:mycofactocin precursor [Pseudomonadota bacterium]
MEPEKKNQKQSEKTKEQENPRDDRFTVEEVEIEEMAIDGICGVY